jgi:hypothetical protein
MSVPLSPVLLKARGELTRAFHSLGADSLLDDRLGHGDLASQGLPPSREERHLFDSPHPSPVSCSSTDFNRLGDRTLTPTFRRPSPRHSQSHWTYSASLLSGDGFASDRQRRHPRHGSQAAGRPHGKDQVGEARRADARCTSPLLGSCSPGYLCLSSLTLCPPSQLFSQEGYFALPAPSPAAAPLPPVPTKFVLPQTIITTTDLHQLVAYCHRAVSPGSSSSFLIAEADLALAPSRSSCPTRRGLPSEPSSTSSASLKR